MKGELNMKKCLRMLTALWIVLSILCGAGVSAAADGEEEFMLPREEGTRQVTVALHKRNKTGEKAESIRVRDPDQSDGRVRGITQDTNQNSDLTGGGSAQTATSGQENVLTGDAARTEFWLTMLVISGVALMFIVTLLHRRHRKQS